MRRVTTYGMDKTRGVPPDAMCHNVWYGQNKSRPSRCDVPQRMVRTTQEASFPMRRATAYGTTEDLTRVQHVVPGGRTGG